MRGGGPVSYTHLDVYKRQQYINGECVVIDGGQWLRGAGEFNDLLELSDQKWDSMEQLRKK